MIVIIILIAFLIGWFGGISAYKYGLKTSPVILPPKNKYDSLRNIERDMEIVYESRLKEWSTQSDELKKQRIEFYEKNPDFPIKTCICK